MLVLVLVAGVWLTRGNDRRAAIDPMASGSVATGEDPTGAVERFLSFADSGSARASAGLDHAYAADGVRRLAGAIAVLSVRDSVGGTSEVNQTSALETLASQLQANPTSMTHADIFWAAATSSAQLLADIQQRRFPTLDGEVAQLRTAAESIDKNRPLLDQKAEVDAFFDRAARVVRAMHGTA